MTENIIGRAEILMHQKKYAEAEKLLKDLISITPDNVTVLTLLAEVNLQQDKFDIAETLINTAIGISPNTGDLFYIKARISIQKEQFDEAEKQIKQSVEINPVDADYYALWASVKLARKQYESALELADKALEFDAENLLALNTRSTALLKLDNAEDSFSTIEGALREDPNNAFTHANYGWNLLEKRDYKKALVHFSEALKNDPNLEYAQSGMVETLKANNIFYRLFLRYAFWMNNLTAKYQWGVIIGFYFATRILKSIAKSNEALRPYITPLVVLLALVAFSTWIITPISNLFLRLHSYGKHLLDKKEKMSANFVGISFLVFVAGILLYFFTKEEKYLPVAVFGFAMMLPFGVMFSPTKYKNSLIIYAGIMAIAGIGAILTTFKTGEMFNPLTGIFILGFIAFQWVANYLIIKQSNF